MPEQTTLGKPDKPKVEVLIHLLAAKICIVFPDGALACLPFSKWEDKSLVIGGKRIKQPHHKLTVLVPAEYVTLVNSNEEFYKKVNEIQNNQEEK